MFVLLSLVLVAALAAGGYVWNLARTFNAESHTITNALPATSPERATTAGDSQNILLIGSDTRDPGADARSDTMMLVHLPGDRSGVYVMSIMRDTWTDIPGHGEHKINAAMALGGVPLMVETVQGLFDVPIDHVAVIDFEGFKGLTKALGGVEVNNEVPFQSSGANGEYFDAGPITLEGDSALKFVRERYAFTDGDYQRVKNQQAFVSGLISRFLSTETLSNPLKINDVVAEISPFLSVDESLDAAAAGSLAVELRNVRSGDIHMFTLPNLGVGTSSDGQSIVIKDDAAIAEISSALKGDMITAYADGLNGENY
ncbi:LCP family protein [Arthrobacter sp. Sa2BUA2]|uniref:LCP family protein n=2 Tax=Arthrobacter pullicola TaxID=2762224 RepID=A0ABR8YML2_9MICC|nr:LCP family protein [Arthrobacter pullicola]